MSLPSHKIIIKKEEKGFSEKQERCSISKSSAKQGWIKKEEKTASEDGARMENWDR